MDDSVKTPGCTEHNFKRLIEERGPKGEWVLCCSKCGKIVWTQPPTVNESKETKPLLME